MHVTRSTHDIAVATYYNLKGSYILYRTEPRWVDGHSIGRLSQRTQSTDCLRLGLRGLLQASSAPQEMGQEAPPSVSRRRGAF